MFKFNTSFKRLVDATKKCLSDAILAKGTEIVTRQQEV